ncbi:MAG: VWA domain-containing protein [Nocardioides sp.]
MGGHDSDRLRRARHRAMAPRARARARKPTRRTLLLLGLALALGISTAVYLGSGRQPDTRTEADESGCAVPRATIATGSEMASLLRRALRDEGCATITIAESFDPTTQLQDFIAGKEPADYWLPDSNLWLDRLAATTERTPELVVDSVASSPVVLAAAEKAVDSWAAAVNDRDLVLGNPLQDTSSFAAIALGTSELSTSEAVAAMAPRAQAPDAPAGALAKPDARLAVTLADKTKVTAVTEQALLAGESELTATVPGEKTWFLEYPLALPATPERREKLAATTKALAGVVRSEAFRKRLAEAHFRAPRGKLFDGQPDAAGIGEVRRIQPAGLATETLQSSWVSLAVPSRTLAVIDVSGSMDVVSEGGSRIDLTVAATKLGLTLFSDTASVGLWAFSSPAGSRLGGSEDYREVDPVRRLDEKVNGGSHREVLLRTLGELPRLTGGGTALHDTAIAAYRRMIEDYDPDAVNAILLFSDGQNDDPGSPELAQTVATLKGLADPERPVSIITIGISEDADADALRQIAEATGGFSLIARRPEDVSAVFQKAMATRLTTS